MTHTKPVRVLEPEKVPLLCIVGVGGAGAFALAHAARLLFGLRENGRRVPGVLLLDGDEIETKNLTRQNFLPHDVGRNKARVLAERYAFAYGLSVGAHPEYLTRETDLRALLPEGSVLVACVDNSITRKILHEKLQAYRHVVYVDAGNAAASVPEDPAHVDRYELARIRDSGWEGQVLAGARVRGETAIPFPGEVLPDLIEGDDQLPTERACGEAAAAEPQRHATNLFAATVLISFLTPLLTDGTLVNSRSFFDARRGYVRSDSALAALTEVAV